MAEGVTDLNTPPPPDVLVIETDKSAFGRLTEKWRAWFTAVRVGSGSGGVPSGSCLDFPGTTLPSGYLWCDGASYLRTDYPDLFAAIGTAHGAADGTHFNVPDRRGRFPRGQDQGAGRDPDAAGRAAMATGGATGDNVGSVQADAGQGHTHVLQLNSVGATNVVADAGAAGAPFNGITKGPAAGGNVGISVPYTDGTNGPPRISSETRPVNFYTRWIIKT